MYNNLARPQKGDPEIPKICNVPLAVRKHPDVCAGAAILYGELVSWAGKKRYVDIQPFVISRIKGISIYEFRKLQKELKDSGFIKYGRITKRKKGSVYRRTYKVLYIIDNNIESHFSFLGKIQEW